MNETYLPLDLAVLSIPPTKKAPARAHTWRDFSDGVGNYRPEGFEKGNYLHIGLPRPLLEVDVPEGAVEEDDYRAPSLPDRFLVARYVETKSGAPSRFQPKAWTLYTKMPAKEGEKTSDKDRHLNVLTRGLGWTANFDGAEGFYALFDALKDIPEGRGYSFCYLAVGWWSDPGQAYVDADGGKVKFLLGAIRDVPANGPPVPRSPSPVEFDVGIGWNLEAALAVLVEKDGNKARSVENFLRLFDPTPFGNDADIAADSARHANAFTVAKAPEGGVLPAIRYFEPSEPCVVIRGARRSSRYGQDSGSTRAWPPRSVPARDEKVVALARSIMAGAEAYEKTPVLYRAGDSALQDDGELKEGCERALSFLIAECAREGTAAVPVKEWSQPWDPIALRVKASLSHQESSDAPSLSACDYTNPPQDRAGRWSYKRLYIGDSPLSAAPARLISSSVMAWREAAGRITDPSQSMRDLVTLADAFLAASDRSDFLSGALADLWEASLGLKEKSVKDQKDDSIKLVWAADGPQPRGFARRQLLMHSIEMIDCFGQCAGVNKSEAFHVADDLLPDVKDPPISLSAIKEKNEPIAALRELFAPRGPLRRAMRKRGMRALLSPTPLAGGLRPPGEAGDFTLKMLSPPIQIPHRFPCPSRLLFRFVPREVYPSKADCDWDRTEIENGTSPIIGYLIADPIEKQIECFDHTGDLAFEFSDGKFKDYKPHIQDDLIHLVIASEALMGEGRINPSVLRDADRARWTIGRERPISANAAAAALKRPLIIAQATLMAQATVGPRPKLMEAGEFDSLASRLAREWEDLFLPIRIGEPQRESDGLVLFFDLRPQPIPEKLKLGLSGEMICARPGQVVPLLLVFAAGTEVSATAGFTPRKALFAKAEWYEGTYSRISPSFEAGTTLCVRQEAGVSYPALTGLGEGFELIHEEAHDRAVKADAKGLAFVKKARIQT